MASKGGEKRNPRRLFSFDSSKSAVSRKSSAETLSSSDEEHSKQVKGSSKPPTLGQVDEHEEGAQAGWTDRDVVASPPPSIHAALPARSASPRFRSKERPLHIVPPVLSNVTVASDSEPPPSPSRARWDHLRQHVLPAPARPLTPSHTPQSSSTASLQAFSARAPAPKSSRLAQRLGFRQVVEHARDAAIDETRKFAYDIQRACWAARYVESSKSNQVYAPFMSSTSVATAGMSNPQTKKHDLRRPQSGMSLAQGYRQVASLKALYQTLQQSANMGPPTSELPHEDQVLSVMVIPFLTMETGPRVNEEQWFALESFDIVVKNWSPVDEAGGIERCIWCTKAGLAPPSPLRTRLLTSLWELAVSRATRYPATTPQSLQALVQGLFLVLPSVQSSVEDAQMTREILKQVSGGSCGELDSMAVEEGYNALYIDSDDDRSVRGALVLEALMKCMENSAPSARRWLLRNVVEEYWSMLPDVSSFSPLLNAIHSRKLCTFTRVALAVIESSSLESKDALVDAQLISGLLDIRAMHELDCISGNGVSEAKSNIVRIVLEMLSMESSQDLMRWSASLVSRWYKETSEWKATFEKILKSTIVDSQWPTILKISRSLLQALPEDVRKPVVTFMLPIMNDQIVEDPPALPSAPLTALLDTISHMYPSVFYKPLFSCAASSKEFAVVNHLSMITVVSKFLPDFWTRNAEMVSVAVMSDSAGRGTAKSDPFAVPVMGPARLGQSVLLIELIGQIQNARRGKEDSTCPENVLMDTVKFALELEVRVNVLLEAKERTALVPPSQRLLFCVLFREIRLLTRSLKSAPWLPRILTWFISYHTDETIYDAFDDELERSVTQIQLLYAAAQEGSRTSNKRRSTMLLSPNLSDLIDKTSTANDSLYPRKHPLVDSLSKGFVPRALKLLVAVSALLSPDDYRRIGPLLWEHSLSGIDSSTLTSTCFIIMQCAEKAPRGLLASIEVDLQSSSDDTRLSAIRKIGVLSAWRFQIMTQQIISDRAHRPFKLARGPLAFVSTDIGSNQWIREDDPYELKDNLPLELRKRLAEIGWTDDDAPVDQQQEWIQTPMSLLPAYSMERHELSVSENPPSPNMSPVPSPQRRSPLLDAPDEIVGLLRRNSSSGGPFHGVKRRAVFVPQLAQCFPRLAAMAFDPNFAVAAAARSTMVDLMRNDPALLTRPVMDLFTGENKDMAIAISSLRAFLHVRRVLPPSMAHSALNSLTGFLKFSAKEAETEEALHDYARTIPIIAKLVTQVSDMSIRELRRAKIETFLIPSGNLWFSSSAPSGPMFPKGYEPIDDPFVDHPSQIPSSNVAPRLASITMIRISQNMLLLAMLKRNQQDVQLVRKNMTRLVLPSLDFYSDPPPLELKDFVPRVGIRATDKSSNYARVNGLSLMLSRSYIPLVAQIFRSMSRHLSDRTELAVLVDGLNRVLLAHGSDIGIVSQTLIALMVASTRFRRLFASGGGYTLFMPAVVKIYTESEQHSGIRLAVEYAVNRFYAHHRQSFIFQTLDVMSHILMVPGVDGDRIAKSTYTLFSSLRRGSASAAPDAAGIHDANKLQEREALMISTAEEKPQTFLASMRKGETRKASAPIDLPQEYESSRLGIDDLVRLFLTVIAHDITIVRAEQFLRFLRFLAPSLYDASSTARTVLREGIDALGAVLSKLSYKGRSSEGQSTTLPVNEDARYMAMSAILENDLHDKSKMQSDALSMQSDYLSLIVAFTRTGGRLPPPASRRAIDFVKSMIRDSPADVNERVSSFLVEWTAATLIQADLGVKEAILFLQDLAPIIGSCARTIDFSGVFTSVSKLCDNQLYANHPTFSQLVVSQICAIGLSACETAASQRLLFTLSFRSALVYLLAQSIFLRGADIIAEIEKRVPTYEFLAGIVLPLALCMKTTSEIDSDGLRREPWHRNAQEQAWARLLAYAISACEKVHTTPDSPQPGERSKSQDRRRSASRDNSQLPSLITALQVIKTIVVRADKDLTSCLPDVWNRLGSFLKTILREGSAEFAMRSREYSPTPSPSHSPRSSLQFDQPLNTSISTDFHSPHLQGQTFSSPRIVDYCLWSFLELLCVYRTPLLLQMRLSIQEKLIALDRDLQHQQNVADPSRPRGRRLSSSVFSKPRRRLSGLATPESSPRLGPSQSYTSFDRLASLDIPQGGYQDVVPLSHESHNPRIVHLGLISNPNTSLFRRSLSPGGRAMRYMARSTKIKSLSLIRATYHRIRTVQFCMGYRSLLLPLPHGGRDGDEVSPAAWTKQEALRHVLDEMKELMSEFEESFNGIDKDIVIVDNVNDQSTTSSH